MAARIGQARQQPTVAVRVVAIADLVAGRVGHARRTRGQVIGVAPGRAAGAGPIGHVRAVAPVVVEERYVRGGAASIGDGGEAVERIVDQRGRLLVGVGRVDDVAVAVEVLRACQRQVPAAPARIRVDDLLGRAVEHIVLLGGDVAQRVGQRARVAHAVVGEQPWCPTSRHRVRIGHARLAPGVVVAVRGRVVIRIGHLQQQPRRVVLVAGGQIEVTR